MFMVSRDEYNDWPLWKKRHMQLTVAPTRSAEEDNELELLNTQVSVEKAAKAAARTRSPLQLPQLDLAFEPAPAGPTAGKPKPNWLGEGWRGLWVGCAAGRLPAHGGMHACMLLHAACCCCCMLLLLLLLHDAAAACCCCMLPAAGCRLPAHGGTHTHLHGGGCRRRMLLIMGSRVACMLFVGCACCRPAACAWRRMAALTLLGGCCRSPRVAHT
jgi:hypothetical protein